MDDALNNVETIVKNFIAADTDIAALAPTIHEKIKSNIRNYMDHELPAIAVHCTGYLEHEGDRHMALAGVFIEIINSGADLSAVDTTVKQILSLVYKKLRDESPHMERGGRGINDELDDIIVREGPVIPWDPEEEDELFLVSGSINAEVYFVE